MDLLNFYIEKSKSEQTVFYFLFQSLDTAPTTQRSSGSLVAPAPSFAFSAPKSVVSESGPLPADELTLKQVREKLHCIPLCVVHYM